MSAEQPSDLISLGILRARLAAIAEEGALTVQITACSPVIAESRDNGCAILDAEGALICGGGAVAHNFGVCGHAVRHVIQRFGNEIAEGDVFLSNDPHNGGGLHAQDVIIQRPIFVDGVRVAWIANAGHMIDMGGMAFGSWAPAATECYQEALRLPPVHLLRAGHEQTEMWDIIRNNVRMSDMVEMDLRSMVAGCQVGHDKVIDVACQIGVATFLGSLRQILDISEREFRRRIGNLTNGTYRFRTWTEWNEERFEVPCTLTVADDRLIFDFDGAAPQCSHFFNSKQHVVESILVSDITDVIAHDIPLSQGLFNVMEVRCPEGTVVNSTPPAPIASSHFDVALNASMAAQQCVMMAIAASGPEAPGQHLLSGASSPSCMGLHTWSFRGANGQSDGWLTLEGAMAGAPAANDRDGYDLFSFMVARKPILEAIDVEMFEQRYPVLVETRGPRSGAVGAGRYRAGAGCRMRYRPHHADRWQGVMLGMRAHIALPGFAGGLPGGNTTFTRIAADGARETLNNHDGSVIISQGERFEFEIGTGGGFGDPFDRDPALVLTDVRMERIEIREALETYGVAITDDAVDVAATAAIRSTGRSARLAGAAPARAPMDQSLEFQGPDVPLYAGVVQRGNLAIAEESGAILARAPDVWMDGCPVFAYPLGQYAEVRLYLDPRSGRILLADIIPNGVDRSVGMAPDRWVAAA